ncbi:hypothetical protein M378DRAFT_369503 [Amanita muscaria Koide BX008]|uniref:Uncharacterized protein n=1 Tax=Amanita muscaria (strain Koide BX008) TaxID=946122 RepID=A0A0C2XCK9_AMAMK|nr:hypothetical protein M378DRAFT_369503 [Amanita muscaria Koide BX008]
MVSTNQAWIIATSVQAILYGLYLATFGHSVRWLLYDDDGWKLRRPEKINSLMLSLTMTIFIFSTLDLGISLRMAFSPHLLVGESSERSSLVIVNNAIENFTIIITDAILILRCWVVYDKSWRVVGLPVFLFFINIACTILLIYWFTMSILDTSRTQFKSLSNTALVVFFSCNFAINIYGACAVVYRIWPLAKKEDGHNPGFVSIACHTFAGFGILYASTSLLLLISRLISQDGLLAWLADVINFSMAGIAFNIIFIRVSQHGSRQHNSQSISTTMHELPLGSLHRASTEDWPPKCTGAEKRVQIGVLADEML